MNAESIKKLFYLPPTPSSEGLGEVYLPWIGYDDYNRHMLITRPSGELTTTYIYNDDGLLESETAKTTGGATATSIEYTYDNKERLLKEKETVPDGKWLEKTYAYSGGNVSSIQYDSQTGINFAKENYTYQNGHLKEIKLGNVSIWNLTAVNAFGQPTAVTTGNFSRTYGYNSYGLPTGRSANFSVATFMNHTYNFNPSTGNLNYRTDNIRNKQENFDYDNMNRLTSFGNHTANYQANGNMFTKSDISATFKYLTPNKPYTISGVALPFTDIPRTEQTITYTSFKRPNLITEGDYSALFTYNGSNGRVKMEVKNNNSPLLTRYYISDCYEIDVKPGGNREKLYLGGDFYTAPAVYVKEGNSSWQLYYIFRDYLGSILHVRTSTGTAIQELSYDAWGRLRKPADHEVYGPDNQPDLFLGRGYTGHEHLPWFGLVNMNARLYDAAVGRFLSPDPIIPNPLNSQDFNRYSYVLNNPLKYNDISGMKPKCKYEGMSNHERNKRNRMRMKDSMDGGSECGEFGVNGSHNRWDGFGAGWGDGGDDYSIGHGGFGGHSGGFGGGGGGGGGNCWGRSRNGGGTINSIDFTFGYVGNGGELPRKRHGINLIEADLMFDLFFHYQFGKRKPFRVYVSDLDLHNYTRKQLGIPNNIKPGYTQVINLLDLGISGTSIPFGKIRLRCHGNNKFSIDDDEFDFDIVWEEGVTKRNVITLLGGLIVFNNFNNIHINPLNPNFYFGGPFLIHFRGYIIIK